MSTKEFVQRRKALWEKLQKAHPDKKGMLLLIADVEHDRQLFFQDSCFLYCVGLDEPSLFFTEEYNCAASTLHEPVYAIDRSVWLPTQTTKQQLHDAGITQVGPLGKPIAGYETGQFIAPEYLAELLTHIEKKIAAGYVIYVPVTILSDGARCLFEQLCYYMPLLRQAVVDCSSQLAALRRIKSHAELEIMYKAVELTAIAHEAAYDEIAAGKNEADVQAVMDFVMTQGGARHAYTPIVGSGKNGTILHYALNNKKLQKGELVVVDAGASYHHYAADITRTYPVNGSFSVRQKELYSLVLDVQETIAALAAPGMFLHNPDYPEKSLNHQARKLFEQAGYDAYFLHGIGHFIGLDVHDVGDRTKPLEPGDVITIEPGLYLREEGIGIRIEDMYWIVQDGAVCLSEGIPKTIKELERKDRH